MKTGCLTKYIKIFNVLHPDVQNTLIHHANKIDGFLQGAQIPLMWIISTQIEKNIAEIGCWKGRTTFVIGVANAEIKKYAIDHFNGSEEHQEVLSGGNTLEEFKENTKNIQNLNILEESSVSASEKFENESLECVFIDAAHDYESVKADILAWTPKLKKGGLLIGHDYPEPSDPNGGFEELTLAVNEEVRDSSLFEDFGYFCGIWGAKKL